MNPNVRLAGHSGQRRESFMKKIRESEGRLLARDIQQIIDALNDLTPLELDPPSGFNVAIELNLK